MPDKGFGRFTTPEYQTRGRSEEAAQRRARIRTAAAAGALRYDRDGQPIDPAGTTDQGSRRQHADVDDEKPPSTRVLTPEGDPEGYRGNETGFGWHISGNASGPSDACQREADSPTAGRGFGRYV